MSGDIRRQSEYKMNHISHFSIYREMSLNPKMRDEAMAISPFFLGFPNSILIDDVIYQEPDPPDFMVKAMGKMIGLELTRSNPKRFGRRGFTKFSEFKKWELEKKEKPLPRHQFEWGTFTLRDSLAAFQDEVERKAERAKSYCDRFDETWLIVQAEKGSPHGGLAEGKYNPNPGREEEVLNFNGKHLFGLSKICEKALPFNYVLLFCGLEILALPVGKSAFNFPKPNEDLLRRGEKASDEYLDWSRTLSSVTRHYDESQGDMEDWLKHYK
jgi:hypothetical protein